jgi:SAM-dependent methyltransferase
VDAFGIDLSPEMIAIARRDYPDLRFEVGTMTDLDLPDGSVTGVLAFWSVIHIPAQVVPGVFGQFRRVLRPGGPLLVGFHVGDETHHTSEGYSGRSINVDSYRRQPEQVPAGCERRASRSRPNWSCARMRRSLARSSSREATCDARTRWLTAADDGLYCCGGSDCSLQPGRTAWKGS